MPQFRHAISKLLAVLRNTINDQNHMIFGLPEYMSNFVGSISEFIGMFKAIYVSPGINERRVQLTIMKVLSILCIIM